jgi:hypothetical protein
VPATPDSIAEADGPTLATAGSADDRDGAAVLLDGILTEFLL